MNILIVDDSRVIRNVLKETLIKYCDTHNINNLGLYEAEDGLIALTQMFKNDINIIIFDWNMPNMTGEGVVDVVRANKEWNQIKIIMSTTEGSKDKVQKMIKKGVNGYIVKPFNENTIFKSLDIITNRMH